MEKKNRIMFFSIYFFINSIEIFFLVFFLFQSGSVGESVVFLNLSLLRLITIAVLLVIGIFFLAKAIQQFRGKGEYSGFLHKILDRESSLWAAFSITILILITLYWLLTRQRSSFGDFMLVFQRLEPIVSWLIVFCLQNLFFLAFYYSSFYVRRRDPSNRSEFNRQFAQLFGVFLVVAVLKYIFTASSFFGPLDRGDEMTYYDMAESMYRGFFSIVDTHHYPPLYPLLLINTMIFKQWTFQGIQIMNVLLSTSLIWPVYLITREFLDHQKSMIAVVIACLTPFNYLFPGRILSENLFYPLFFWTMFITFVAPQNKKFRIHWVVLNGAMLAALLMTRYITFALVPFFLLAWVLKESAYEKETALAKKLVHFALLLLVFLLVISPWLIMAWVSGLPLQSALGFDVASHTTPEQLTFARLVSWVILYACYFCLVAAPVLQFLLLSFTMNDLRNITEDFTRWIIQILAVMSGFFAAVVRHSWRAFYNAELPSRIMGRYLIVLFPMFLITGLIVMDKYEAGSFKSSNFKKIALQFLSFILVTISYLILIEGKMVHIDYNFVRGNDSVDVFYVQLMGKSFLILILIIQLAIGYFLFIGKKSTAFKSLLIGLAVFYLVGIPAYHSEILDEQTYPWLSNEIKIKLEERGGLNDPDEHITVFLPEDSDIRSSSEIYNGLRIRGVNGTEILNYSSDIHDMSNRLGFIIHELPPENTPTVREGEVLEFNHHMFTLELIQK